MAIESQITDLAEMRPKGSKLAWLFTFVCFLKLGKRVAGFLITYYP